MSQSVEQVFRSQWAASNPTLFQSLQSAGTTTIHASTGGLHYLEVLPYLGIEDIMHKPPAELIGKAAAETHSVIGQAKDWCCRKAIEVGSRAQQDYEMEWNGAIWRKRIVAVYLPGCEEVLCRTEDLAEWQRGYWQNYAKYLRTTEDG